MGAQSLLSGTLTLPHVAWPQWLFGICIQASMTRRTVSLGKTCNRVDHPAKFRCQLGYSLTPFLAELLHILLKIRPREVISLESYFPTGNPFRNVVSLDSLVSNRFAFVYVGTLHWWTIPSERLSYFPRRSAGFLGDRYSFSLPVCFVCASVLVHIALLSRLYNFHIFLSSTIELA